MEYFYRILFLCPMLFLAGLIDGIAGGGGVIAMPAYLLTGLPIHVVYGCNKLQSCVGTAAALVRYARSGYVDGKIALIASGTAILGSYLSTQILLTMSDTAIKWMIAVAMCFVLVLMFFTQKISSGEICRVKLTPGTVGICFAIGLILGLYDGFFGPGGGTVALMLFTVAFHYDMRTGNGNGKVIIVISNLVALVTHLAHGNVWFAYAIPATIANVVGSYLGASLGVKKGSTIVRKIMVVVVLLVLVQAVVKMI